MLIKNATIKNLHIQAKPVRLVAGWLFNVSSLTDWAGVTPTGSPALRESKYLEFIGTQYLTTDTIATNSLTNNDVTYEFWLRTTGTNSGCLLSKRGDGGYSVSAIEISDTNLVPGYWTGVNIGYDGSTPNITRDSWQHYTVTYTTGGALKTYYNGTLVHSTTFAAEVAPREYNNAANQWFELFKFESTSFGHGAALTGDLGEFRLYTRVLTDAEVNQNFRATRTRWGITPPTGLTSADPSTSAYQIKQDYPASTDGLYWIQNANINSGNPVQIYADMTTLGGGWTLLVQNTSWQNWDASNALSLRATTPPGTLSDFYTSGDPANNYSILSWADYIKRSASGFDYMFDAGARGRNGGAWTANEAYSFVEVYNSQPVGTSQLDGIGWRKNITEITRFPLGLPGDNGTWDYNNDGVEARMPWYAAGHDNQAALTTDGLGNSGWWGTIIDYGTSNWSPAPWMNGGTHPTTLTMSPDNPQIIWYWVR